MNIYKHLTGIFQSNYDMVLMPYYNRCQVTKLRIVQTQSIDVVNNLKQVFGIGGPKSFLELFIGM